MEIPLNKSGDSELLRFTSLHLKNWKNFVDVQVPLAERVFLIGPNATGKSNFLDVFRFLKDLVVDGGGLGAAIQQIRGGLGKVRSLYARLNSDIEIEAIVKSESGRGWRYKLVFHQATAAEANGKIQSKKLLGRGIPPAVVKELVFEIQEDGTEIPRLERPDENDKKDPQGLKQTAIGQLRANETFRELSEFFGEIQYLHMVPQLVKEGVSPNPSTIGHDPYGRDLLDQVRDTPKAELKRRLAKIQEALKIVTPQFKQLKLKPDDKGKPHLEVKFEHWRPQGAYQNETQFSDGTLRLIGLLWSLQDGIGPLLLEEPELSLHPAIVKKLAAFIHKAQSSSGGRQVILSTHSADVLADPGISAEEILLIEPSKEGSLVKSGASIKQIKSLIESGIPASEAALPVTESSQLQLFGKLEP